MPLPLLTEVLDYRNQFVIDIYCKRNDSTPEKAVAIFIEMLKYLWLSEKNRLEKNVDPNSNAFIAMYPEMNEIEIDTMWHTFILCTKDYTDFGLKYFGCYIHHRPRNEPAPGVKEFEMMFSKFLNYVYDNLGEETVRKWFAVYCKT